MEVLGIIFLLLICVSLIFLVGCFVYKIIKQKKR